MSPTIPQLSDISIASLIIPWLSNINRASASLSIEWIAYPISAYVHNIVEYQKLIASPMICWVSSGSDQRFCLHLFQACWVSDKYRVSNNSLIINHVTNNFLSIGYQSHFCLLTALRVYASSFFQLFPVYQELTRRSPIEYYYFIQGIPVWKNRPNSDAILMTMVPLSSALTS